MGLFWTMMWWFLLFAWIVVLFRVIADIFRSPDLGGGGKALWVIFVIIVPWLGVLVYLIARGHKMTAHDVSRPRPGTPSSARTCRTSPGPPARGTADELAKLADLQARGVITEDEFAQQKAKLLA